ncbi:MAG: hypothetical protein QUV35_15310 [Hydrogenophaga sp.]|uniref:hypothetical protein n=1 Tax=Hydrogenophaga sp. TaxID=1904254 RepID=UPI0026365372|nr:hypothetical protein [Hydrogenophaga sp.]MDM7943991.1 hypothetical protein [Hydrogenophaga sp.]
MKFKKSLIKIIAAFILPVNAGLAQNDISKWGSYVASEGGGGLFYNYESLKRERFPPRLISVKIFNEIKNQKNYVFDWELKCISKEIKVGTSNFLSIASDGNTTRRILLEGLCGVRNDEGLWFIAGATTGALYAINSSTLRKISNDQFSFTSMSSRLEITSSTALIPLSAKEDYVISCSDRTSVRVRPNGSTDPMRLMEISTDSIGRAAIEMVCSGYIAPAASFSEDGDTQKSLQKTSLDQKGAVDPEADAINCRNQGFDTMSGEFKKCMQSLGHSTYLANKGVGASADKVSAQAEVPENISLKDSTAKCEELGFKKGTERFGKCVLTISR